MKKVINGKKYNTETAKEMACVSYGAKRDFQFWEEILYQKKTGEFFLYGIGGPMSKYAVLSGQNQWTGSEKITMLTLDDAKKWAEKYLDGDEYEKIFGIIEETGMTKEMLEKIKNFAKKNFCDENTDVYGNDDEFAVTNPWMDHSGRFELTDEEAVKEWGLDVVIDFIEKAKLRINL